MRLYSGDEHDLEIRPAMTITEVRRAMGPGSNCARLTTVRVLMHGGGGCR